MDEMAQAQRELDRLEEIVARHEAHMFALRGWLIAVVGGLLAAYYTANINISETLMQFALVIVVGLFLFSELRHENLVEAVVERITDLEQLIAESRQIEIERGWYDGPKMSKACANGANRWLPRLSGMTGRFYGPFYGLVVVVVFLVVYFLPQKG